MKKYLLLFFALIFVSLYASADEATDSMEAALATHSDALSLESDTPESLPPSPESVAVPEAPAVAAPASAVVPEPPAAPIVPSPEPAAEPVKARDVLPETPSSDSESDALGETVLDEEGNEVSAKSLVLKDAAKA